MQRGEQPFRSGLAYNAELQIAYSAGLQALQLATYTSALRCFQVSLMFLAFLWWLSAMVFRDWTAPCDLHAVSE